MKKPNEESQHESERQERGCLEIASLSTKGNGTIDGKKVSKDSGSSNVVNQVPENSAVANDDSGSTPSNAKAKIGRYIVRKELGRGAFGTVYAAEDPILKRNVAIKLRSRQGDEEYDQTVIREARAAGKLRHPNIVAVYEVDVASGRPFVVSELIEGQTLAEMIQEGP